MFWVVKDEAHHKVEKLPRLYWATHYLTVAYDCASYPNISIRMV